MLELRKAPVIRLLFPYALGCYAGILGLQDPLPGTCLAFSICIFCLLLLLYFLSRSAWLRSTLYLLFVPAICFLAGLGGSGLCRPIDPGLPVNRDVIIAGEVAEEPVSVRGRLRIQLHAEFVLYEDTIAPLSTMIRTFISWPDKLPAPCPGEKWIFGGKLQAITNAGNPREFDFTGIMNRKNCWYFFFAEPGLSPMRAEQEHGHPLLPHKLRAEIAGMWKGHSGAKGLLSALCLGDKSGLEQELKNDFSRAGAMHVLAVSGLHVGLIWWMLNLALAFVVRLTGKELYRMLLILCLLWFYAWLTGFSASVSRSVSMFSLFSVARLLGKQSQSVNVVMVAMFLLLVADPLLVTGVGFQLSFLAVLSIVILHPRILPIFKPGNRMLKWVWEATVVSLCAQLGTLPLVLYYFQVFPLYGLLSNLVVLPLLSLIMGVFVISVPWLTLGIGEAAFGTCMVILARLMMKAMDLIGKLPASQLGPFYPDAPTVFLCILLLFLLGGLLLCKRPFWLCSTMFLAGLLMLQISLKEFRCMQERQVTVAHFRKGSLISFQEGRMLDHYILCRDSAALVSIRRYIETAWGMRAYHQQITELAQEPAGRADARITSFCRPGRDIYLLGNDAYSIWVFGQRPNPVFFDLPDSLPGGALLLSHDALLPYIPAVPEGSGDGGTCHNLSLICDGSNSSRYCSRVLESFPGAHNTGLLGAWVHMY